ncbi:MAG: hypothetical protein K6E85_08090 [Lachnospiraceae bacterium]|nr:hypothetical protein [Lachnospiraceae bacterium]
MDEDLKNDIISTITDTLESAADDMIGELSDRVEEKLNETFLDDISDEIADRLEERIDEAISDSISEFFAEGLEEFLEAHQFVLKDGTIVQSRQKTKILAPDKKKLLNCYGGLRVENTEKYSPNSNQKGWGLAVQTRISSWELISVYEHEANAIAALMKVENAIVEGAIVVEL